MNIVIEQNVQNNRAFDFYNLTIIQNNVAISYFFVAIYCNNIVHCIIYFSIYNMDMSIVYLFLHEAQFCTCFNDLFMFQIKILLVVQYNAVFLIVIIERMWKSMQRFMTINNIKMNK